MSYPVPPPEPPAIIQTVPKSETYKAQKFTALTELAQLASSPSPTARVTDSATISYPLPEAVIDEPEPSRSAEVLGSPLSLDDAESTVPAQTSTEYKLHSSRSFTSRPGEIIIPITPLLEPEQQLAATPEDSSSTNSESITIPVQTPEQINNNAIQSQNTRPRRNPREPNPTPTPEGTTIPIPPAVDIVEVTADRQEYDQQRQIVTAQGNVMVRFRQSLIDADQAQVNLNTRQVVAQGNVALTRGNQVLRGDRMNYNFVQNTGSVFQATGTVFTPSAGSDLAVVDPAATNTSDVLAAPISDRITAAQPVGQVEAGSGLTIGAGVGGGEVGAQGNVNRFRFAAEQINLFGDGGWEAQNVRITNDPFSPPELELRADTARFTRVSPLRDELITTRSRLVFDQNFSLPLFRERTIIDRRQREALPFSIGYDLRDFGGYYIQGNVPTIPLGPLGLSIAPRYLIQRQLQEGNGIFAPQTFGVIADLSGPITPTTSIDGVLKILDFENFPDFNEDDLRGSVRVRQQLGGFALTGEYSYRNRLFNGTLGYRTVHSSLGAILTSPVFKLNDEGAQFSFQSSYQSVNANTDRPELLQPIRRNDRVTLDRYEAVGTLIYPIRLWRGEALPATATEGLRYTARPVTPYVQLAFIARGVTTQYSENYSQSYLSTSVGVQGQLGHFSRAFLDYTGFSLFYTQVFLDGQSPFLFDRLVDQRVLSTGLVQQIYGGIRAGIESSINLENGLALNNELTLEYSRRTYGVLLRINPVRRIGSINLRISDFNWVGTPDPDLGTPTE